MNVSANFCPPLKAPKIKHKSKKKYSERENQRDEYDNISSMTQKFMGKQNSIDYTNKISSFDNGKDSINIQINHDNMS